MQVVGGQGSGRDARTCIQLRGPKDLMELHGASLCLAGVLVRRGMRCAAPAAPSRRVETRLQICPLHASGAAARCLFAWAGTAPQQSTVLSWLIVRVVCCELRCVDQMHRRSPVGPSSHDGHGEPLPTGSGERDPP